jgi:hypothetical protein
MDSALLLKTESDKGLIDNYEKAKELLAQSDLFKQLLTDNFQVEAYQLMNRLNELTEIPFTQHIPKVKNG